MNYKVIFSVIGGGIGWIIGEFKPTFPLIIVAIILLCMMLGQHIVLTNVCM